MNWYAVGIYIFLILLSFAVIIYSIICIVKYTKQLKNIDSEEEIKQTKIKRIIFIFCLVFSSIVFICLVGYPYIIGILINLGLIGM